MNFGHWINWLQCLVELEPYKPAFLLVYAFSHATLDDETTTLMVI